MNHHENNSKKEEMLISSDSEDDSDENMDDFSFDKIVKSPVSQFTLETQNMESSYEARKPRLHI